MRTVKKISVLLLLLLGGSTTATSQRATIPTLSTSSSKTYYVIQNAGTKEYLCATLDAHRIWTESEIKTSKQGLVGTQYTTGSFLWYFEDTGTSDGGMKVANKHAASGTSSYNGKSGAYLLNTKYSGDLGYFDGTGSTWYLSRFDFNESAWTIHDTSNKYWMSHTVAGTNYVEPNDLTSSSDDYFGWILRNYDELVEEATDLGVTQADITSNASDRESAESFKWLINAINTAKNAQGISAPADGNYVIKNRRYGLYLNSNGTSLTGTCTPSEYSVWELRTVGGILYLINTAKDLALRTGNSTTYWDLEQSQSYSVAFAQSSDKSTNYVKLVANDDASKYMGMQRDATIYKYEGSGITGDWEFIPLADYLAQVNLDSLPKSITSESEISEEHFYMIANVAQNFDNRTENTPDTYGWLTDFDYVYHGYALYSQNLTGTSHAEAFANNTYSTKRDIDTRGMSASALWHFIRVGSASTGGENATGLLSPEHDIFLIRNANTNKYISNLSSLTLTTNKSDAGMYYLQKHMDGQFSLMNYTGTNSSGSDTNNGALSISGTTTGNYAGISRSAVGTKNDASGWIIVPTPKIHVSFLTDTSDKDGYHWSTFYFPFDVVKAGTAEENSHVDILAGGWIDNTTSVRLRNMGDAVPAGNAVVVRSDLYDAFDFYAYPPGKHEDLFDRSVLNGNIWKGVTESEGHYFGPEEGTNLWKNYWILNKSAGTGTVKLLHPGDDYLMPNRAYLDKQAVNGASTLKLDFFEDDITAIDLVEGDAIVTFPTDNATYDLQGRRVVNPTHGIYIRGGKKIFIP